MLVLGAAAVVEGVPLSFVIDRGGKECLYDVLHANEFVTMSVFITAGHELKGVAEITGPIARSGVTSGTELWNKVELLEQGRQDNHQSLRERHIVNYEDLPHLYKYKDLHVDSEDDYEYHGIDDDQTDDMYYYHDFDGDMPEWMGHYDDDTLSEEEKTHLSESDSEMYDEKVKKWKEIHDAKELKKKQQKAHKTLSEKRQRRAELMEMTEGGPFQRTYQVAVEGWYRLCVSSKDHKITAEIEMRKQSELGNPNRHTGHLMTYERFEMLKEERKIARQHLLDQGHDSNHIDDEDLPLNKQLVQPSDVVSLNAQLKEIHRMLQEVKEKQQREKHRLTVSAAVNEHTHARMVINSLFETVFYIGISAYQVYTIRRWFAGGPMLGF